MTGLADMSVWFQHPNPRFPLPACAKLLAQIKAMLLKCLAGMDLAVAANVLTARQLLQYAAFALSD
jgi:hypothetical protein